MPAEEPKRIRCPACGAELVVPDEWRLVECTRCGAPITRMSSDPAFD